MDSGITRGELFQAFGNLFQISVTVSMVAGLCLHLPGLYRELQEFQFPEADWENSPLTCVRAGLKALKLLIGI